MSYMFKLPRSLGGNMVMRVHVTPVTSLIVTLTLTQTSNAAQDLA